MANPFPPLQKHSAAHREKTTALPTPWGRGLGFFFLPPPPNPIRWVLFTHAVPPRLAAAMEIDAGWLRAGAAMKALELTDTHRERQPRRFHAQLRVPNPSCASAAPRSPLFSPVPHLTAHPSPSTPPSPPASCRSAPAPGSAGAARPDHAPLPISAGTMLPLRPRHEGAISRDAASREGSSPPVPCRESGRTHFSLKTPSASELRAARGSLFHPPPFQPACFTSGCFPPFPSLQFGGKFG